MAKVTGIGGVFFKAEDKAAMRAFFGERLGVPLEEWGAAFPWREHADPTQEGQTVLSVHKRESDYFDPSPLPFMINFRVDDLDAMLADLRAHGVEVVKVFDPESYGKFAHVMAPGGLKIELWQPTAEPAPT